MSNGPPRQQWPTLTIDNDLPMWSAIRLYDNLGGFTAEVLTHIGLPYLDRRITAVIHRADPEGLCLTGHGHIPWDRIMLVTIVGKPGV